MLQSVEGPSRSEPIKSHVWLTVPAAALMPLMWPPRLPLPRLERAAH